MKVAPVTWSDMSNGSSASGRRRGTARGCLIAFLVVGVMVAICGGAGYAGLRYFVWKADRAKAADPTNPRYAAVGECVVKSPTPASAKNMIVTACSTPGSLKILEKLEGQQVSPNDCRQGADTYHVRDGERGRDSYVLCLQKN